MENFTRRPTLAVAALLLLGVATQIVYIVTLMDVGIVEGWLLRSTLWTIELVAFALLAVFAAILVARAPYTPFAWSAIAVSGVFNALQAGIGLSMFKPATEAGEAFAPLMDTVLGGAFLFFFLAKLLVGLAGIALGSTLFGRGDMPGKIIGGLSILAGLAAAAINLVALPQGLALVFPAGAAGTAATLLTGIAILMLSRNSQ